MGDTRVGRGSYIQFDILALHAKSFMLLTAIKKYYTIYRSVYIQELKKLIYGSERHAKRWRGKHGTLDLFSLPFTAVAR